MKGIIAIYLNFHPDLNQDIAQGIEVFKQCNKDLLDLVKGDTDYQLMIVPTTKEACRIEKIDLDKPFPRFVSKSHTDIADLERRREERFLDRAREREREDRKPREQKED